MRRGRKETHKLTGLIALTNLNLIALKAIAKIKSKPLLTVISELDFSDLALYISFHNEKGVGKRAKTFLNTFKVYTGHSC